MTSINGEFKNQQERLTAGLPVMFRKLTRNQLLVDPRLFF